MAQNNTKLELTWIGKYDEQAGVEPRNLIENPKYSYGEIETGTLPNGKPWNGNMLIHGDNLLALQALKNEFAGCVKCIYIDPPYNTGSAFEYYDDGIEHSIWLSLMRERLNLLYDLLSRDGYIFVQIDDNECAYLTLLMDEVFGRENRINTICVNMSNLSGVKITSAINGKRFPKIKEYILLYAKDKGAAPLRIPRIAKDKWDKEYNLIIPEMTREMSEQYEKGDVESIKDVLSQLSIVSLKKYMVELGIEDSDDNWKYDNAYRIFASKPNAALLNRAKDIDFDNLVGIVSNASGTEKLIKTDFNRETKTARIELVCANTNSTTFLGDHWPDIVTTGGVGQEGNVSFPNGKKPEKLISRIIECSTLPNDIVLDSFLGSGTTAAVAHKMKRRYIGVEMGEHAYSHCYIRLKNVIDGNDSTGVTKKYNWIKGGGFKFFELAPSLLKKDTRGNLVINKEYNADMLSAAMAKHQGFVYQPSSDIFWKQGYSSENDFIFTTTQFMTVEALAAIEETMKEDESLLVCCKAFQPECKSFSSRISIKKIPSVLLDKCEFDHDDYSLNIIELPEVDSEESFEQNSDDNIEYKETLF